MTYGSNLENEDQSEENKAAWNLPSDDEIRQIENEYHQEEAKERSGQDRGRDAKNPERRRGQKRGQR